MFVFIVFVACGTPAPVVAPSPPPATAHEASPHSHSSPHGGIVQTMGANHLEALMMPEGILFYMTDAQQAPVPLDGYTGKVVVKGPDGVVTTDLMSMGDHLHAVVKLAQGQPASAVLTLTKDGTATSASFETSSVGMQSHDHTSLHGGKVLMRGNWHVEYAPKDGEYRMWLTDELRNGLTDGVTATLTDGDSVLPMALDEGSKMLSVKAEGAGSRPVTVQFKIGAEGFSMDFDPVPGG